MHRTRLFKGTGVEERIVDLYILMMFFIYPLYISNYMADGMNMKYVVFILITFMCASIIVFRNIKGNKAIQKQTSNVDYVVIGLAVITAFIRVVRGLSTFEQATELAAIAAFGLGYFVIIEYGRMRLEYLHFFLCSAAITCVALIPGFIMKILDAGYFHEGGSLVEYFLLVFAIAVPMYLQERKKRRKLFYFIMCMAAICLLLLSNEAGGLLMLPFIFIICIITLRAKLYIFKGFLNLLLALFIILKSFSLMIQYSGLGLFVSGITHDVTNSFLVDIVLVTVGIIYCLFLDNTTGFGVEKMNQSYPKVRVAAMKFFKSALFLIVIGVFASSRLTAVKAPFGSQWFAHLMQFISEYLGKCYGTYAQMFEKGGIVGVILILFLLSSIIRILINQLNQNETNRIFLILFITLLIQNFIYPMQSVTTPIYMILFSLALGNNIRTGRETGGAS